MYEGGWLSLAGGGGIYYMTGGWGCRIIKVQNEILEHVEHNTTIEHNAINDDVEEVIWFKGVGGGDNS